MPQKPLKEQPQSGPENCSFCETRWHKDLFGYIAFNPVGNDTYNTKIMIDTTKDPDLFRVVN
jgi:hypothetical protein